jgi:coproporphyrinogen III oxidase-like Fe-S oxidoreductase
LFEYKAQLFKNLLDLDADDAEELENFIRQSILETDYENGKIDEFGIRFIVDFKMNRFNRAAIVRTTWIILVGEEIPRMTSCYLK